MKLRNAEGKGVYLSFAGSLCIAIAGFLTGCGRQSGIEIRFTLDAQADAVQILQFYVSDVWLQRHDGTWKEFSLSKDSTWQNGQVALLDLGPGSQGNRSVTGTVDAGEYSGIRFSVAVPFGLNHANPVSAGAPLDRPELYWTWQSGYKFFRLEFQHDSHAYAFHLGSTGCSSASALRPPLQACAQPNIVRVELPSFDPGRHRIAIRASSLISIFRQGNQSSCSGDYASDPTCSMAYAAAGLDHHTGSCVGPDGICTSQQIFGAVP